jgi:hypothetical protein
MSAGVVGWRLVEYRCRSCNEWCLLDHTEPAAKYHECRSCYRVPDLDRERVDHRLTSLLWAHQLVDSSTYAEVLPSPAGRSRECGRGQRERSATQRTRPGSPPATPAGSPVSRTVALRDSVESSGGGADD